MKKNIFHVFFSVLALLYLSCKKEHASDMPIESKLNEKTIVFNSANLAEITYIDSVSIIMKKTEFSETIFIGSIINGGISTISPNGFLRVVQNIVKSNDQITFETSDAQLTDAVISGVFEGEKSFTFEDIELIDSSGIDISERGGKIVFSIQKKEIYDQDGNPVTTNDKHYIEGSFEIEPKFYCKIPIFNSSLTDEFVLKFDLNISSNLKITHGSVGANFDKNIILKVFKFKSTPISGPLSLILKPYIVISVGLDGELTGQLIEELQISASGKAEVKHKEGIWYRNAQGDVTSTYDFTNIKGNFMTNPYVSTKLIIRPFDIKYPRLEMEISGKFRFEGILNALQTKVNVNAQKCLEANAKILIGQLFEGYLNTNFEANLFNSCEALLSKEYSIGSLEEGLISGINISGLIIENYFYDPMNNLQQNETLLGDELVNTEGSILEYDQSGRLIMETTSLGEVWSYLYNSSGKLEKISIKNSSKEIFFEYDGNYLRKLYTNFSASHYIYEYSSEGNLNRFTFLNSDNDTTWIRYEYNADYINPYQKLVSKLGSAWFRFTDDIEINFLINAFSGKNMPSKIYGPDGEVYTFSVTSSMPENNMIPIKATVTSDTNIWDVDFSYK